MRTSSQTYTPVMLDLASLLAPISEEYPGGKDCRLSGDMNILLSLVVNRKREADFQPQYGSSYTLATSLLCSQTKDLGIAVRLIEAGFIQHGLGVLVEGLMLLNGLCEHFWLTLFPAYDESDFEARGTAIGALQDLLCAQMLLLHGPAHEYVPPYTSRDEVELLKVQLGGALEELDTLNAFCYSAMGNDAPNFDDIRKDIQTIYTTVLKEYQVFTDQDRQASVRQLEQVQEAQKKAVVEVERAPQKVSSPSVSGTPQSLEEVLISLQGCTAYLMEHHPDDPLAYVINRGIYWYSDLGAEKVASPTEKDQAEIASLVSSAQPRQLIQSAERCFAKGGHQWLDLQWYQVLCADRLGKGFLKVSHVLKDLTALCALRHEELLSHHLTPDCPALSEGGRKWVDTLSLTSGSIEIVALENLYESEVEAAEELAKKGNIAEAIGLLLQQAECAPSGRERCVGQLHVVEFALKHGQARHMIPTVERLSLLMQESHYDRWENRHFLERVYQAGYDCYLQAYGTQKVPKEKVDHYYALICSVNPAAFIKN